MPFPYKHVLMIGATSGIGAAMADRLVKEGSKVIAVGRRQDRLDDFVDRHGKDKASAVRFDINDTQNMGQFVSKFDDDISAFSDEQNGRDELDIASPVLFVNSNAVTHLSNSASTGSNLAIVPAAGLPAYSASKAALNSLVLCLRDQLRHSSVKVIELSPPPVQTELHDYKGEQTGRQLGMPLDAFTDAAFKGLASGSDQIVVGSIGHADTFNEIIDKRRTAFENLAKMMRGEK